MYTGDICFVSSGLGFLTGIFDSITGLGTALGIANVSRRSFLAVAEMVDDFLVGVARDNLAFGGTGKNELEIEPANEVSREVSLFFLGVLDKVEVLDEAVEVEEETEKEEFKMEDDLGDVDFFLGVLESEGRLEGAEKDESNTLSFSEGLAVLEAEEIDVEGLDEGSFPVRKEKDVSTTILEFKLCFFGVMALDLAGTRSLEGFSTQMLSFSKSELDFCFFTGAVVVVVGEGRLIPVFSVGFSRGRLTGLVSFLEKEGS